MTATAEATRLSTAERLQELRERHAQLYALVHAGEAGEETILEEQRVREQLVAAEAAHSAAQTKANRERINAEAADRRSRLNAMLDRLAVAIPELTLALVDFNAMRDEIQTKGMGFAGGMVEDHLTLPTDFADKLLAAIREVDREWDFSATGPLGKGKKPEHPKQRTYTVRLPRLHSGPPIGYTGTWDMLHDRPFEEPTAEEPGSVAFLPPAG